MEPIRPRRDSGGENCRGTGRSRGLTGRSCRWGVFDARSPKGKPSAISGQQSAVSQKPLIVEAASAPRRGETSPPRVATAGSAPWVNTATENEP